jgi:hypothetical protein
MCEKAYSDILPHCGVTSCLDARDILPSLRGDILPRRTRRPAFALTQHPASFPSRCPVVSRPTSSLKEASTDDQRGTESLPNTERS